MYSTSAPATTAVPDVGAVTPATKKGVDDEPSGSESLARTGMTTEPPDVTVAASSTATGGWFAGGGSAGGSPSAASPGAASIATVAQLTSSDTAWAVRRLDTGHP